MKISTKLLLSILVLAPALTQAAVLTIESRPEIETITKYNVSAFEAFVLQAQGYICDETGVDPMTGAPRYTCDLLIFIPPMQQNFFSNTIQRSIGSFNDNLAIVRKTESTVCLGIFEHSNLKSHKDPNNYLFIRNSGTYDLQSINNFAYRASSFFFTDKVASCSPDGVAQLHQDSNQRGRTIYLPYDMQIANLRDFDFNDKLSSLTVPAGFCVEIWKHKNFGGTKHALGPGVHSISNFNDQASSVKVSLRANCN